jgi:anti-sigma regulatory factor (Ser/Thr protein kinase)
MNATAEETPDQYHRPPRQEAAGGSVAEPWSAPVRHRRRIFAPPALTDTTVIRQIREWTRATSAQWGVCAEAVDSGGLVVSELATNAFRHTDSRRFGAEIILLLSRTGQLRIEVRDHGRPDGAAPAIVEDPDSFWEEHGRGLAIVDALCDWDVREIVPGYPTVGHVVSAVPRQEHAT